MKRHLPIAAVMLCAAVLLTWRLGAVYLWQDEAATAVMAERMLKYGKPLAYDGRNLITMDSFVDEDRSTIRERTGSAEAALRYLVERRDFRPDTTWVGQPWGQFVAAGASLGLLGHGTWQARLPFALAALATVLLVYLVAMRVFEDRATAVLAAVLLTGNAFWILHSRQSRYYALSSLMMLVSVAAFLRWQRGGRWGAPLFVLAGWTYFQCDYGSFFPSMGVLALVAAASGWPRLGRPAGVFAALGVTVAPFAWYYGIFSRIRNPTDPFEIRLAGSVYNVNQYVIALPALAVAGWLLWRKRQGAAPGAGAAAGRGDGDHRRPGAVGGCRGARPFHRYFVVLTPLAALVSAWTVAELAALAVSWSKTPRVRVPVIAGGGLVLVATCLVAAPVSALDPWPEDAPRPGRASRAPGHGPGDLRRAPRPQPPGHRGAPPAAPGRRRILVSYEDIPFMFYTDARIRGGVAAFRAEDQPPPRFLVIRRSVISSTTRYSRAWQGGTSGGKSRLARLTSRSATFRTRPGSRSPWPATRSSSWERVEP